MSNKNPTLQQTEDKLKVLSEKITSISQSATTNNDNVKAQRKKVISIKDKIGRAHV